jgi:hypothetical protein
MSAAASLLKEKHHGVLISAVQLCMELCKASYETLEYLRKVCMTRSQEQYFFPGELSTLRALGVLGLRNSPSSSHSSLVWFVEWNGLIHQDLIPHKLVLV